MQIEKKEFTQILLYDHGDLNLFAREWGRGGIFDMTA